MNNIGSKKQDRSNDIQTVNELETLDRQALKSVSGGETAGDRLRRDLNNAMFSRVRSVGGSVRNARQ